MITYIQLKNQFLHQNCFLLGSKQKLFHTIDSVIKYVKLYQVNRIVVSKTREHLASKLAFCLRYHNLAAFFFYVIGDLIGYSLFVAKSVDIQYSPKMSFDNDTSANLRMIASVWAEIWRFQEETSFLLIKGTLWTEPALGVSKYAY